MNHHSIWWCNISWNWWRYDVNDVVLRGTTWSRRCETMILRNVTRWYRLIRCYRYHRWYCLRSMEFFFPFHKCYNAVKKLYTCSLELSPVRPISIAAMSAWLLVVRFPDPLTGDGLSVGTGQDRISLYTPPSTSRSVRDRGRSLHVGSNCLIAELTK